MISSETVKNELRLIEWEEGKIAAVLEGPYRYRIVIRCSETGRQKAQFANGEFPYGAFIQLMNAKAEWVPRGASIVPVLPDGRILMIIEQRQLLACFPSAPRTIILENRKIDLGETGALEFPGGGVEKKEGLAIGALRELFEETGVIGQPATLFLRNPAICAFNADIAGMNWYAVVFLTSGRFEDYVSDDGGFRVLALAEKDIERNIRNGVISSGQAAVISWYFYQEVMRTRRDEEFREELIREGYLEIREVIIQR
jgi:8-oxo-dGTP pyrophosphatase MutT (NUDIX family)